MDKSGGSSIAQVRMLKDEGKAQAVGFAAHCHVDDQIAIIETDLMDYVNLHFGFFSCVSPFVLSPCAPSYANARTDNNCTCSITT